MNRIRTHICYLLFLIMTLSSISGCADAIPSDEYLKKQFFLHKTAYEKIAAILIDNKIYRIELKNGDVVVTDSVGSLDVSSMKVLEKSLKEIGVNIVTSKVENELVRAINFINYREGLVFIGESKGISLALGRNISKNNQHKVIEENWYIFHEKY